MFWGLTGVFGGSLSFLIKRLSLKSYHHGEGEGHDVDGPQRAEAGQDGQDQVVPRLGPVYSGFCDGAGLAGERGPGRARH